MTPDRDRWRRISAIPSVFSILSLSFLMAACAGKPDPVAVSFDVPRAFSNAGTEPPPERWWTAFGDSGLNRMMEVSLGSNFEVKSAYERLRAARAVLDRETSARLPSLEASVEAEKRLADPESEEREDLVLGMTASYEVDLWGRVAAAVSAEEYRARSARSDYQAAALSLSAETTLTWYRLAEAQGQLNLLDEQIRTNETVLELLENRFGTGQIRAVDILRQRQLLASTRERRALAEARREVLKHRLAVLAGRPPRDAVAHPPAELPVLPSLPETGIPVDLVERRPDIQVAYNRLLAADRDVAVAVREQYPRLNFSVAALTRDGAGGLFENWALSFMGDLLAPIFLGGELRAEVDRTRAERQSLLYDYGQSVLTAFSEVEDALVLEDRQAESLRRLQTQVELASQAHEQLQIEYFYGAGSYIDVLVALTTLQDLRRNLLTARLALVEHRVALYRALAGGFATEPETAE